MSDEGIPLNKLNEKVDELLAADPEHQAWLAEQKAATEDEGRLAVIPAPVDKTDVDVMTADFTWRTINAIAKTEFIPQALRNRPSAILACVLAGREIGLPPMESLRSIDIIDGKVNPSAELMLNLIRRAGHRVEIEAWSDTGCTLKGTRLMTEAERTMFTKPETMTTTYDEAMAKRAGLLGKHNWKQYPEAMYYWRALAMLARTLFADVISALKYLPEELGSETWHETPPDVPEGYDASQEPDAPMLDAEGDIIDVEEVEA